MITDKETTHVYEKRVAIVQPVATTPVTSFTGVTASLKSAPPRFCRWTPMPHHVQVGTPAMLQ